MNHGAIAYTFYERDYRVRRYAEALASKGDHVDVIALKMKGSQKHSILNKVHIHHIQGREFDEKGIWSFVHRYISFFCRASLFLSFKHLKYRYKTIHIHNAPEFLVFVALIPKFMGAKVILDMHENVPEFFCAKFGSKSNSLTFRILLFVEKMSTRYADKVIAAHDLLKIRLTNRNHLTPSKCISLRNYPDLKFFKNSISKPRGSGFRIIYPGTVSHHHGIDVLISSLATIKEKIPGLKCDIYTRSKSDVYLDSLLSLVNELNLKEIVKFHEPFRTEEIGKILSNADLGVVPKRGGIFASEAFSTKIQDFMAAGIPVIASRTKIDEYYFDDSMIMFFEPENYHDLAGCILKLYKTPNLRRSLVKNAKKFIAKNNWEAKKEVYHRIIDQLAE